MAHPVTSPSRTWQRIAAAPLLAVLIIAFLLAGDLLQWLGFQGDLGLTLPAVAFVVWVILWASLVQRPEAEGRSAKTARTTLVAIAAASGLAIIAFAAAKVMVARYAGVGGIYMVDRLTGTVRHCSPHGCRQLRNAPDLDTSSLRPLV